MRFWPYLLILVVPLFVKLVITPEWQESIGSRLKSLLVPIIGPIIDFINTPFFVYLASFLIFCAAIVMSWTYYFRVVRSKVAKLRHLANEIVTLPRPNNYLSNRLEVMTALGNLLR